MRIFVSVSLNVATFKNHKEMDFQHPQTLVDHTDLLLIQYSYALIPPLTHTFDLPSLKSYMRMNDEMNGIPNLCEKDRYI